MEKKGDYKQDKRVSKKAQRLRGLIGVDLCACAGGHKLRCSGICRESHVDGQTGHVECGELYQIGSSEVKSDGQKKPKRDWKYGRQKNIDENRQDKQNRHKKRERDHQND